RRRQELVCCLKIRRRKAELAPPLGAANYSAVDKVMMPEQRAGFIDAAFRHEPPDARTAHDEVFVADGIDLLRAKAIARSQGAQHSERAGAIVAEQKVGAHPDLDDPEPFD